MYKEIEELEAKINSAGRKPAQAIDSETIDVDVANKAREQKNILTLPKSTHFSEETVTRNIPGSSSAGDSMVGQVAPDYSGYEHILANMKRPTDTSMQDLINMGVSTGIGILGGRGATGAKIAGEYGLSQAEKQAKRDADFENQLMKLNMARAAQMAKGQKGKVVKGASSGLSAKDVYKMKYIGHDGLERNYRFVDDNGVPVKDINDPIASLPTIQLADRKNSDGSVEQIAKTANQMKTVGSQNAASTMVKNAKGEMVPVNTRTVGQEGLPENFNQTQMALSPSAQKKYDEVSRRQASDSYLARYQTAASDLDAASAALGSDGELSPGFLLSAQRFLGMGMDKGRSLTNDEFNKVEGVNTGLVDSLRSKIIGYKEGKVSSDAIRQEYRKLTALLSDNVKNLRNERIGDYNKELKKGLGNEYRPELGFEYKSGLSGKGQDKTVQRVEKLSNELRSDKAKVVPVPGQPNRKVRMGFNPQTDKYDRYLGEE